MILAIELAKEKDLHNEGNIELTKVLLAKGADAETLVKSLYSAASENQTEVAKLLFAAGADARISNKNSLWTPLHWATSHGNLDQSFAGEVYINLLKKSPLIYFTSLSRTIPLQMVTKE